MITTVGTTSVERLSTGVNRALARSKSFGGRFPVIGGRGRGRPPSACGYTRRGDGEVTCCYRLYAALRPVAAARRIGAITATVGMGFRKFRGRCPETSTPLRAEGAPG
jgi:hypothetical protein